MKSNIANILSLMRMIGIMVIFLCTPFATIHMQCFILLFYCALAFTDFLDGQIARSSWGKVTILGKILDPAADKMLVLIYLPLLEMGQITSLPVGILLAREMLIFTLRLVVASQGTVLSARWAGKIKTAISLPLAAILIARIDTLDKIHQDTFMNMAHSLILAVQSIPQWVINGSVWALCAWTLYTVYDYFNANWAFIRNV